MKVLLEAMGVLPLSQDRQRPVGVAVRMNRHQLEHISQALDQCQLDPLYNMVCQQLIHGAIDHLDSEQTKYDRKKRANRFVT